MRWAHRYLSAEKRRLRLHVVTTQTAQDQKQLRKLGPKPLASGPVPLHACLDSLDSLRMHPVSTQKVPVTDGNDVAFFPASRFDSYWTTADEAADSSTLVASGSRGLGDIKLYSPSYRGGINAIRGIKTGVGACVGLVS